jgi:hypothetical protein
MNDPALVAAKSFGEGRIATSSSPFFFRVSAPAVSTYTAQIHVAQIYFHVAQIYCAMRR